MSESRKERIKEAMERAQEALRSNDNHTADEERENMDKPQEPQPIISLPEVRSAQRQVPDGEIQSLRDSSSPLIKVLGAGVQAVCDDVQRVAQEETAEQVAALREELMFEVCGIGMALAALDERPEALESKGRKRK